MSMEGKKSEKNSVSRRKFLSTVGGLAAVAAIGWGLAGYLSAFRPIERITETKTITKTETKILKETITKTVTSPSATKTLEYPRLEGVTIDFWTELVEEPRMEVLNAAAKEFKKLTGITVNVIPVPEQDYPSRITAAYAAKKMPHVMEVPTYFIPDWLKELDHEAATEVIEEIGKNDFPDFLLKHWLNPEAGDYYAIPWIPWVAELHYRKDWFEEAGLETPTDVISWDQILNSAETLHNPPNRYGIVFGNAKAHHYSQQSYFMFGFANEVQLLDEDLNVRFDDEESIETLAFMQELKKYTPTGPNTDKDAWTLYPTWPGTLAMAMVNTYMEFRIYNAAPELIERNVSVPLIRKRTEAQFGENYALGIFRTNATPEQIEAAKAWCKWMLDSPYFVRLCGLVVFGLFPARKSIALSNEYLSNPIVQAFGGRRKVEELLAAFARMKVPAYAEGRGIVREFGPIWNKYLIADAVYEVCVEGKDPRETAERYAEKMREEVKKVQ